MRQARDASHECAAFDAKNSNSGTGSLITRTTLRISKESNMHIDRRLALIASAVGGIVLLAGCGASIAPAASGAATADTSAVNAPPTDAPPPTAPAPTDAPTVAPTAAPTAVPTAAVTIGQSNAAQSAAQYLSTQPFSRAGLIQQLSSSAGEGFSLADATYGVDAQHADWNAQAALSAKQYLSTGPFSRAGLIEQLSSSAGEGFTYAQAVYGVTAAGL
jgi:hypothetical protein